MTDAWTPGQYTPHAVLNAIYERLFERIHIEDDFIENVRNLATQGTVLYVLPNLNWLDFFALDYLTKRYRLPPIQYANDLGLGVLNPRGPNSPSSGVMNMLLPTRRKNPEAELRSVISSGGSAALFLKRPPSVLDVGGASGGRGLQEGDELVHTLFRVQRRSDRPLILVPLLFAWSKSPDRLESSAFDFVLGPRNWPTPTRALWQFVYNMKHVSMRSAEAIDLQRFLATEQDQTDGVLVRRLTYTALRRLERERRSMVGPAEKSPARIRAEILRSPKMRAVIEDLAGNDAEERTKKTKEAARMLMELQATPSPDVIKAMGVGLRWGFSRIYRGIDFDPADVERVRNAAKDGALVLLPSHKSHIDYLVLSYFFYEQNLPMPLIAAGDNLNFQPVGPIFRRAGAFFIRRSFKGDRLYAGVVDAYIRRLIRDGYPLELFLEGGRSRTGKLLEPKLGLLNMIVDGAVGAAQEKVRFVPLSIGYERLIEADSYHREALGGEKKKEEAADLLNAREVLEHRYGRINLQFGNILSLKDICAELGLPISEIARPAKRRSVVTRLANRVMDEINRVTAVSPGALTALALLQKPGTVLSEEDVLETSRRVLELLVRMGARTVAPTTQGDSELRAASIREALQMFVEADLVEQRSSYGQAAHYFAVESQRVQLDTSKNIIIHFFVERALVATALNRDDTGGTVRTAIDTVRERVRAASRLFKHEFRFRADAPFEAIFEETISELNSDGHILKDGDFLAPGPGEKGWSGAEWVRFYQGTLRAFFESYYLAARALVHLIGTDLSEKELVRAAIQLGDQLYALGEIERKEAISKPTLQNAFHALAELGVVRIRAERYELTTPYQDTAALEVVASDISASIRGHREVHS